MGREAHRILNIFHTKPEYTYHFRPQNPIACLIPKLYTPIRNRTRPYSRCLYAEMRDIVLICVYSCRSVESFDPLDLLILLFGKYSANILLAILRICFHVRICLQIVSAWTTFDKWNQLLWRIYSHSQCAHLAGMSMTFSSGTTSTKWIASQVRAFSIETVNKN